ncbi:MAG: hypothetical protein ACHQQR_14580, partial [Gemmatimonadales bacterium]
MSRKDQVAAGTAARSRTFRGRAVDLVIDVRSKLEFWLGHLDGATCMPVDVVVDRLKERSDVGPD